MTFKSKLKTTFDLKTFKLCHVPNLMSIVVKMPELRRRTDVPHGGGAEEGPDLIGLSPCQTNKHRLANTRLSDTIGTLRCGNSNAKANL